MGRDENRQPPPIGLMPEKTYEQAVNAERIRSIVFATERYLAEDYPIPPPWVEELNRRQNNVNTK